MTRSSRFGLITLSLLFIGCAHAAPRGLNEFVGTWHASFSRPPLRQIVHGTIHFDSVGTIPDGGSRLWGRFQLDSTSAGGQADLVVALLGGPDGCVQSPGAIMAYKHDEDFLEIEFTPHAADCGLVGHVSAQTLEGHWQEPSFVGTRAQGDLRIQRR